MSTPPQGAILAIETSWDVGSMAVALPGGAVVRRYLTVRARHADRMIPAMEELLGEAGLKASDLAGVVVGSGPGSFTGVRVAAASAKGLVAVLQVPLYPVSSLAGAARSLEVLPYEELLPEGFLKGNDGGGFPRPISEDQREIRYILFDARDGRVYGASYDVGAKDMVEIAAPHGGTIVDVLNSRPPLGTIFAGDGAMAHESLIRAAGFSILTPPCGVPTADGLLGACTWAPVDAGRWDPDYVREWRPG